MHSLNCEIEARKEVKLEVEDKVAQFEANAIKTTWSDINKNNVEVETTEETHVEKATKTKLQAKSRIAINTRIPQYRVPQRV